MLPKPTLRQHTMLYDIAKRDALLGCSNKWCALSGEVWTAMAAGALLTLVICQGRCAMGGKRGDRKSFRKTHKTLPRGTGMGSPSLHNSPVGNAATPLGVSQERFQALEVFSG